MHVIKWETVFIIPIFNWDKNWLPHVDDPHNKHIIKCKHQFLMLLPFSGKVILLSSPEGHAGYNCHIHNTLCVLWFFLVNALAGVLQNNIKYINMICFLPPYINPFNWISFISSTKTLKILISIMWLGVSNP